MRQILEERGRGGYDNYRIPGIVRTGKNSLLVYYECRNANSDWAPIDIGMRKSTDGGKTWSGLKILVEGDGKTVNNPVMFRDGDELLLLWQEEYRRTFSLRSRDDGETWEDLRELTEAARTPAYDHTVIACGPGHGTVLSTGRYIVPTWLCSNHEDPKAHHPSVVTVLYSDDRGETWQLGDLIAPGRMKDPSETTLAELEDGRVLISIRHEDPVRRRMTAVSESGIGPWEGPRYAEELLDPICEAGMVSGGGAVYLSHCDHERFRQNLTVHKSTDGGAAWGKGLLIDESAGYSDIALSADGKTLYVIYERTEQGENGWHVQQLAFDTVQTDEI